MFLIHLDGGVFWPSLLYVLDCNYSDTCMIYDQFIRIYTHLYLMMTSFDIRHVMIIEMMVEMCLDHLYSIVQLVMAVMTAVIKIIVSEEDQ